MRDNLKQLYAVAAAEWRYLFRSGIVWKLSGANLTAVGTALLLSWPGVAFSFEAPPSVTWRAFLLSELAFTGYVALGNGAELIGRERRVRAKDWVSFGLCAPGPLLLGKLAALSMLLASVYAAALPVALLAGASYPVPLSRVALFAIVLLPHGALLSFLGVMIGAGFPHHSDETALRRRRAALHALFALIGAGTLALHPLAKGGLLHLLNPVSAVDAFFPPNDPIHGALPQAAQGAWSAWAVGSAAFTLLAGASARRSLDRLAEEGAAPHGKKPSGENLRNTGGGVR